MSADDEGAGGILSMPPELHCYRLHPNPPPMIPARPDREWMDDTTDRFAYRCTPLPIANASGWELVLPFGFAASWNGGARISDLTIMAADNGADVGRLAMSVFGEGILTFHPGYLFRTSPGWAIGVRGLPNTHKDGIAALEGVIETDWSPFSFTMNWRFTRPGLVRFEKGEAFCFLTLVPHGVLDAVQPVLHDIADDPRLNESHKAWSDSRLDFKARIDRMDRDALRQGWQRDYLHGRDPTNNFAPGFHITRRRLREPREG